MSPRFGNGKVSRALNYIISSTSNYLVKYNLAKCISQTKCKRWMLVGYICSLITLSGIALVNNEVRLYVLYPFIVVLGTVMTNKVLELLEVDASRKKNDE